MMQKDIVDSKLSELLKTFRTKKLSLGLINKEVENMRREIYEAQKH